MSTKHYAGLGSGNHKKLTIRCDLLLKHHLLRAKRGGRAPKECVMLRGFGHTELDQDRFNKGYVLVSGHALSILLKLRGLIGRTDLRGLLNRAAQQIGLKSAYRGRATCRDAYFVTRKFIKRMGWKVP